MRRARRSLWAMVVIAGLVAGCGLVDDLKGKDSVTAPSGATLTLATSEPYVPANGTTTVTVEGLRADGRPLEDGTRVTLRASSGALERDRVETRGGRAAVAYRAGGEPGEVRLEAASGGARAEIGLMVGSNRVATVKLETIPATLPADGGEVQLVATARAAAGEPVVGVPVTFNASGGTLAPSTPVASDGQGQARARLRLTAGASVRARTPDAESSEVVIRVAARPPETPPAPPDGSGLDLRSVTWLDVDVSGWPVTSTLKGVSFDRLLCMPHTKAGEWPVVNGLEGNPWVFVNLGGRWYAGTFEWLAPGQTCKGINADNIGAHTTREPLRSWRPQSGELVGIMVSTHARWSAESPARERSNIVMVRWP